MKRTLLAALAVFLLAGCGAHWTGYDLFANAGLQQNEGDMSTKATSIYAVGAKIHFDRDRQCATCHASRSPE